MADYSSVITQTAQQYGVDPSLALAVAQQESGGQQYGSSGKVLTSSAGALGIFQLEPGTAADLGIDPTDPIGNIQGGILYLAQMLQQFGGNVADALAAYNAGPGTVQQYGGVPPYPETQNYVSSIMAAVGLSPGDTINPPATPVPRKVPESISQTSPREGAD